jgi:hypothetical protein
MTSFNLLQVFSCIVLFVGLVGVNVNAQELSYTSGPTRAYSFTTAPAPSLMFNGTSFEWYASRGEHMGLAYLDGVSDSVNLWSYPDDSGQYFPAYIGQRSFSVCVWAQFLEIQTYSRLFETSAIYDAGDNIAIMAIGNGGGLGVRVYSGSTRYGIDISRAITPSSWQHVCLVGDQVSLTDSTSNTAANYTTYINARPVGSFLGPLPRNVFRGIANIGKSSFLSNTDNLYYRGWIDSLYWYNYQLQDQQIAAHYVCKRPPVFDIAFAENPSQISGITNPTYGFVLTDPEDVSAGIASYRKGLLTFDGSTQFVDLTAESGSNSIGTRAPTLGGNGYGTDYDMSFNGYLAGWSFECLVKFTQINNGGRVYSFSDGGANDIYLGFNGASTTLMFGVSTASIVVRENTPTNTWMHIVVTISRQSPTTYAFNVFVNGQFVRSGPGVLPAAVTRGTSYLARSSTSYLGMKLDSMRIFDYNLGNVTIASLYTTTNSPLPTNQVNATREDMYSSSPVAVYGFDNPNLVDVSNFNWTARMGDLTGIAVFSGNPRNFVDLSTFPDDYGRLLPRVFGGEMSIEARVMAYSLNNWARLMDFGGRLGREDSNVYLAIFETSADMLFNTFSGTASTRNFIRGGWKVGKFQHIVCTIKQIDFANPYSSSAAQISMYLDGVLITQGLGYLPAVMERPNVFLARSNWQSDARFRGALDYFAYYQYPLSPEQVAAHACVAEGPIFETAFNSDPRVLMSNTTAGYSYNYLPLDDLTMGIFIRSGILTFSPASSQYVDLTTYQAPNGMGTILPSVIGGSGVGIGTTAGWTFETQFLLRSVGSANVFDFGAGTAGTTDRIRLGIFGGSNALRFGITNSLGGESNIDILPTVATNTWFHILIIVTLNSDLTASYFAYVNGILVGSLNNVNYPVAVSRPRSYIARSQEGTYADMYLDVLRIYNYAITENMVRCVYRASTNAPSVSLDSPVYSTRPINLWGFENPWPDTIQASYQHVAELGGRYGVAYFDGQNSFANLGTYSDSYGLTVPPQLGGQLTFQTWLRFSTVINGMRIFDFSNGNNPNSFNLTVMGSTDMLFTIYGDDGTQITTLPIPSAIPGANIWFHIAIVIAQVSRTDSSSLTAASVTVYINGNPAATQRMKLPASIERLQSFLARGLATTNVRYHGHMDSFAIYNYPVQPESLKVHIISSRLPVFELDFAMDPRDMMNLTSTAGYSWLPNTPEEGPAGLHKGVLSLSKASSQYVNLQQTRGINSLGVALPEIGGHFSETFDWTSGLTIQITFLAKSNANSILFATGNLGNSFDDHIRIVIQNGGLIVEATRSRTSSRSTMTIVNGIQTGVWYHAVIVFAPSNNQWTESTWTAFVNGRRASQATKMVYPQKLIRDYAQLGGNSNVDAFDGYIDSFRIFDHLLSVASIQNMYALTADLSGRNQFNLGCGQYTVPPAGSILVSFILKGDIATLDNTFGTKIETILAASFGFVGCHSVVGSRGRVSLAVAPNEGESQVRVYLYHFGQTTAEARFALFKSMATQGTLNQALSAQGLPPVDPGSVSIVYECADGSVQDSCPSGSSSGLSGGAIAGIVIGVIAGVILLIVLAVLCKRSRNGVTKSFDKKETGTWESQQDDDNDTTDEGGVEMN